MTPTTAVTMLFKRIVAIDSYPVVTLTDREKATNELMNTVEKLLVNKINSKEDALSWLEEDE